MAEDMMNTVLDATLGIKEQYNERRKTIREQMSQAQQMLMQAQSMCSQGNQGACQSLGQLNSQMQMLKADLDRLDIQEAQDMQDVENYQRPGGY